jgi:hypothetical protein
MTAIDSARGKSGATPQEAQQDGQGAISQDRPTLELDEGGRRLHDNPMPPASVPGGPLSDRHIAVLADIGGGQVARGKHRHILAELVAEGFLESASDEPVGYKLTGKAQNLLAQRGAGLNEA